MSVKQADDKTWYARVSYKVDGKYKKKNKYNFKTKKEAQIWEADIHAQLNNGMNINLNPVFADYFMDWLDVYKRPKIASPTLANYIATHKKIELFFGDARLKSITRTDYQRFINECGEKFSKGTVLKTNKHIRSAILDAVHNGNVEKDFTYKIELSGKEGKKESTKFISQSETKKLLRAVHADLTHDMTTRYMIILALFTGMRYSEIAGLTFADIDYTERTILVDKSWDYRLNRFKPTKTNRSRTIKLEHSIMQVLKNYITEQKKRQLAHTHITNPNRLVFAQYDGTPPSNDGANKALRHACKRAGIQEITFHSLRHTHVSILLYNGMDLSSIAKRVGHKSTTTTADTYAHIIEELQNKSDNLSDSAMRELLN